MLLNIFSTSSTPPSSSTSTTTSASKPKTGSDATTKSSSTSNKKASNHHKSASALKYMERRQQAYKEKIEEKYGPREQRQRDDDTKDTHGGNGRDRDRSYGNGGGFSGGNKFQQKNNKLPKRDPLAAPDTKASTSKEEALPMTTLIDTKATALTKEEKINEQRIGTNTNLLAQKTPFGQLGLAPEICTYLESIKFTSPTQIQSVAIPALIAGRDTLIQAQTGSGKTLCYLLPVLHQLQSPVKRLTRDDGTQAIILAPTRELVIQIEEVWKNISKPFHWLVASTIMGGAKKKSEKARLRTGCHIIIGTPGRIVDHLGSTQSWMLGNVNWFILDEADRLFDLGFRDSVKQIYEELISRADVRPRCALVSATLSKKQIRDNIFELSSILLQDPVHVGFDGVQEILSDDEEEDKEDEEENEQDDNEMNDEDDEMNDHDEDDEIQQTVTKPKSKKSSKHNDSDDDTTYRRGAKQATSDDDEIVIDSEEEEEIQRKLLSQSVFGKKSTITMKDDSDSDSDTSDSEGSDSDSSDANNDSKLPNYNVQLPTEMKPIREVDTKKLLPKFKEKSMDHLQGMSRTATNEETQEALESVTASFVTPTTLEQLYVKMSSRHRLVVLGSFLRLRVYNAQQQDKKCKMIVFVSTCASVEFLHKIFQHAYWPDDSVNITGKFIDDNNSSASIYDRTSNQVSTQLTANIVSAPKLQQTQKNDIKQALINTQLWKLHGNMSQELRTQTYRKFCDAKEGILFSTDVAARGLDLPLIDWIVQYDPPEDTEDYIHRIGRTARIGHSGRAILFLLDSEEGYLQVLKKQGATDLKQIPLPTLLSGLHVDLPPKSPLLLQDKPLGAILQKQFEKLTTMSTHLNTLAKASYIAFVRAYATYPKALKGIFHPRRLHLGEVAHSFALTETPSEITKHSREILRIAEATINPTKVAKDNEAADAQRRHDENKKSLTRIAKVSERRQQMAEFL